MNRPNCEIEKHVRDIDAEVQRNNEEIQKLAARNNELAEQKKALQEQAKVPVFDKDKRTVRWQGSTLKLSPQRFQILCTLYFAASRHMSITDLEEAVWGEAKHGTIKSAISKLGTLLNDTGFPFYIEGVKSKGGDKIEVNDRKGHRIVKTRPALAGFRLIQELPLFGNPS